MIRSMTGYGEAERRIEQGLLRAEIKTVNHRFLNTSVRTPPGFDRIEHELQGWLRAFISRGHVHLIIGLDRGEGLGDDRLPELDVQRARRYATLLRSLKEELALSGEVDVAGVARFPEIFRAPDPSEDRSPVDPDEVRGVVQDAARAVVGMREVEGRRLHDDMEERLAGITRELSRVETLAPERLLRERDRLRAAVSELTQKDDVDEDRLAREIAYLAERWDINEEIVRFRSHVELFRETLDADVAEPVGKRLSFVVQEMHREANTIGSKANDSDIGKAAVAMKEEIERLREQVENVE